MTRVFCVLQGHGYENEIQTITQLFYPNGKFLVLDAVSLTGITAVSEIRGGQCRSSIYTDGLLATEKTMLLEAVSEKDKKRIVKLCMFNALKEQTGLNPPWGALTGIRPSKIARQLLDKGNSREQAISMIRSTYKTSMEKTNLCIAVAEAEAALLRSHPVSAETGASLYIGIPFCPTRCLYCSFTSYPLDKMNHLTDPYLRCLAKELDALRDFFAQKSLTSLYIGGGTPTSLDENQLDFLLRKIHETFPLGDTIEFTFEAGRPDTINREKLKILKDYHVSRISINPQTMHDKTLERIGRLHTVSGFIRAYHLAREMGHQNINTDIIIGLPGETDEDVAHTMRELAKLCPDSVTVHTLAIKRASRLKESLEAYELAEMNRIEDMLTYSREGCRAMNLHPYYMYRQKNMLGNFENVGYSAAGKECLYNVIMMEETQSVAAAGAGAVTKIVHADSDRIERVFNVKNVEEYINRIDEMINRKTVL